MKGGAAWAPGSGLDAGIRLRTPVCSLQSLVAPVSSRDRKQLPEDLGAIQEVM